MGIKVDTLFYNKYNIAVCNVLFFLEKSKILKIVTLLFSLIIVIVPLHVFDFTWNNKIKKWNPTNANYKTNRANIISLFICVILYRLMCIVWKNDKIPVDISHILGNLITVIFNYQILRKPLKILSL